MYPASAIGPPKPIVPRRRKYPTNFRRGTVAVCELSELACLFIPELLMSAVVIRRLSRSRCPSLAFTLCEATLGGEAHTDTRSLFLGFLVQCRGGRYILQCHPCAVEDNDFLFRFTAGFLSCHNRAQFCVHVFQRDDPCLQRMV